VEVVSFSGVQSRLTSDHDDNKGHTQMRSTRGFKTMTGLEH